MDITKCFYPKAKGHYYMKLEKSDKTRMLLHILDGINFDQIIICLNSVSNCKVISDILLEHNIQSVTLHDKLSSEERLVCYQKLNNSKRRILVTTNLANFCLHIQGANIVIIYDMPATQLDYMYNAMCIGPFCSKNLSITFVETLNHIRRLYGMGTHATSISELSTDVDPKLYNELSVKSNVPLQYYMDIDERDKESTLLTILDSFDFHKAVIFVNCSAACKPVMKFLNKMGYKAVSLHGAVSEKQRRKRYFLFLQRRAIIVATNFGECGLMIKGVSIVINYDMPKTTDEYYNRVICADDFSGSGLVILFAVSQREDNFLDEIEERLNVTISYIPQELEINNSILKGKYDAISKKPFWVEEGWPEEEIVWQKECDDNIVSDFWHLFHND
uniref:Helicase C-terminal domain-containing protein n=1 Tax=Panagrellus redivivus TaxID=6233 RepID=A0A7E4W5J9_PANRE